MKSKAKILLLALVASTLTTFAAEAQTAPAGPETRYLVFQVWPAQQGYPGIPPLPGRLSLTKEQMTGFAQSLVKAIGATGDAQHKLGFAVGPFSFDVPDDETRQWIRDAFAVARENDVAVAIHIDDSMSWGNRKDLLSDPDNIETADWNQIPNTARNLAWGFTPTKFPPQMCYNAPAIVAAAKDRAALIGAEIKRELAVLKSQGKESLFAGVIAGSETQISQEFGTGHRLGFRALAHRGFSEKNPPKDLDAERVSVVKEWIELWCNSLREGGAPPEKIFCHIAFTDQGLKKADGKESYAEKVSFAPPEVAFSPAYRPGFSTYPEAGTFKEVHAALAAHGSPGWISAEGTNVSPTTMPGERTMETYLGRVFNHGGVLVNVFSWGIGGEAQRDKNFFRKATENPEALAAYAKFLHGENLAEDSQGFSEAFHDKMRGIQTELPGWVQKTGQQTQAMSLMQKIQSLAKARKWDEADKAADEVLAQLKGDALPETKPETSTFAERLPAKIHKIQADLPAWIQKTGNSEAVALMQKMQGQMKAKDWQEVEKTADAILKMMDGSTPPAADSAEAVRQRVAAKIGRVKDAMQQWAKSGRDPSDIARMMQEKVGPLLKTEDLAGADVELDRVLAQMKVDGKDTKTPTATTQAAPEITEEVRDKLAHNLGTSFLLFRTKVLGELKVTQEQKEKLDQYLQTLLPEALQVLQKANGERGKYNQKTHEERAAVLKETLSEDQRTRLHQLELQKDLLFGPAWNMKELQITDEQQKQFMGPTQEAQKKTMMLMEQIHQGANPDEIRPKALQVRLDLEIKLETLLTDAQKEKWKQMLGKPVDLSVIYGGL